MHNANQQKRLETTDVRFVKDVAVGSVNPNVVLSDAARQAQTSLLNRCLNDHPRGIVIGKDIAIGRYTMGEHELVMQKTIYHVGFPRKPAWLDEKGVGKE
jgi:hypothetical protein